MRTILALLVALAVIATVTPAEATGGRRGFLRQRQVIVQPRQRIVVQQQRFVQPRVQRFVIQQPQRLYFAPQIYTQPLVLPRQQILIIQ